MDNGPYVLPNLSNQQRSQNRRVLTPIQSPRTAAFKTPTVPNSPKTPIQNQPSRGKNQAPEQDLPSRGQNQAPRPIPIPSFYIKTPSCSSSESKRSRSEEENDEHDIRPE